MPDHPFYQEDKTEFSIYENSKRHLSEKAVIRKHLGKFSNWCSRCRAPSSEYHFEKTFYDFFSNCYDELY